MSKRLAISDYYGILSAKVFTLLWLVILTLNLKAQYYDWGFGLGNQGFELAYGIEIDNQDNIYVLGEFQNTVDFNPDPSATNNLSTSSKAQFLVKYNSNGIYQWSYIINTNSDLYRKFRMAIDGNNNIYTAGVVSGNPLTINGWIKKFSSNGTWMFQKVIGGPTGLASRVYPYAIDFDAAENAVIAGRFNDSIDFDPSINTSWQFGYNSTFIAKYNPNGDFIDVFKLDVGGVPQTNSIGVDDSNNIYLSGYISAKVDFDPGPDTVFLEPIISSQNRAYLAKYDSNFNLKWVFPFDVFDLAEYRAIVVDNDNNVYIAGSFSGTYDMDPGPGVSMASTFPSNARNAFVIKLNSQGNLLWFTRAFGQNSMCTSIKLSTDGHLLMTGNADDSLHFNPVNSTLNKTYFTMEGSFVAVFDTAGGNNIWVRQFVPNYQIWAQDIVANTIDEVYSTGYFNDTIDLDPDSLSVLTPLAGGYDIYVSKLGKCLKYPLHIEATNCPGSTYYFPDGDSSNFTRVDTSVLINQHGCDSMVITDLFVPDSIVLYSQAFICPGQTYSFPDGDTSSSNVIDTSLFSSKFGCDSVLITNLNVSNTFFLNVSLEICEGDSILIPNGEYRKSLSIDTCSFLSTYGCDSVVICSVDVTTISDSIILISDTLQAVETQASFQWIDCATGLVTSPIDTIRQFKPLQNGYYAVVLTKSICQDTSICAKIDFVGVGMVKQWNVIVLPNPTTGSFTIDLNKNQQQISFELLNSNGQYIIQERYYDVSRINVSIDGPSGMYFGKLKTADEEFNFKLIKE